MGLVKCCKNKKTLKYFSLRLFSTSLKWIHVLLMVLIFSNILITFGQEMVIPKSLSNADNNFVWTSNGEENFDKKTKFPSEVQKAVCAITAGEVKASAEAITTKTLKGVCGSDEMRLAFNMLEEKIRLEINEIKEMLYQLIQQQEHILNRNNLASLKFPNISPEKSTAPFLATISTIKTPKTHFNYKPEAIETEGQVKNNDTPQLKNLENPKGLIREQEALQFNNPEFSDRNFKLFTYYWELENFSEHIKSDKSVTILSPLFYIKDKPLQLKASFQHLHRDYLFLQLDHSASKTPNQNNIILDLGGLFKQIKVTKNEVFKHKISVMDQNNQHPKDLVSQELTSFNMGFLIPNTALLASSYIKNNSIFLKLILYL